jgi:hypothetical protein
MFYKQTLNKFQSFFDLYTFNLLLTTIQPSNDFYYSIYILYKQTYVKTQSKCVH